MAFSSVVVFVVVKRAAVLSRRCFLLSCQQSHICHWRPMVESVPLVVNPVRALLRILVQI